MTLPGTPEPPRSFNVVIGDSNDWTLRALASLLSQDGFEVVRTRTAGQLVEHVRAVQPDLIVVGSNVGDISGADACRVLTGMSSFNAATPILVVASGMPSEAERVANLRAGAWDTIRLPTNSEELLLRVRRFVDVKMAADHARLESLLDARSGFYNLRGLLRRAEEEASEAWRAKRPIACVVFGPDQETQERLQREGNGQARALSRELSEVFRRMGRRSDVIARRPPARFIVVVNSTDQAGAIRMAGRMLAEMQHLTIDIDSQARHAVRMLAGCYSPDGPIRSSLEPREWILRAGGALRRIVEGDEGAELIDYWRPGDTVDETVLDDPPRTRIDPYLLPVDWPAIEN